jgi:hypothetical protein
MCVPDCPTCSFLFSITFRVKFAICKELFHFNLSGVVFCEICSINIQGSFQQRALERCITKGPMGSSALTSTVIVTVALAVGLSVTLSYYQKEKDADTQAVRDTFGERASKVCETGSGAV